mgnify:CR=1 FL=1
MENNYYQIYVDSVTQLASSMVIKSTDTANLINAGIRIVYGDAAVDLNDPTTWKYYLNMVGEYHPTDTPMQVVSVDTLQTIDFTRENLQFHRGTAKAYAYGSTYYKELVNKYPNQEQLILGILYPAVDLDTCINATEGTILSYPPQLVEEWEYSLIPNVQKWIYAYLMRWYNQQYTITDELYTMTVLAIMYMNLIPAIITARMEMTKTNEAHSYHVRQYLASNGMLDNYITYLTRKQALFLYRNIAYIYRNSGKTATFNWLMEHIMTERGLPLARFEMRHDLTNQPANLKPELSFEKIPLNTQYNYDQINQYTLTQVFDKEDPLARDNVKYRDDEQAQAQQEMQYSKSNRLNTKLLESTIIDYSGSEHYTLADTLLYHWIWLSSNNKYRAYVQVTSPATNETLSLTAQEAFTFYAYASCAIIGNTLETVPAVIAKRVIRTPRPTVDDLMTAADVRVVPRSFAEQMLAMLPVPQTMISVESFYQYCTTLWRASLDQYYIVCQETAMDAYGQKYGVINRCWADVGVQTGDHAGQFYADWFTQRNIAIADYTKADLATIANDLLASATGVDSAAAITLKDIQAAMVRLMGELSSYSVQYVAHINDGPVVDANTGTIRYDDWKAAVHGRINYPMPVRVQKVKPKLKDTINLDVLDSDDWTCSTTTEITGEIEVGPDFEFAPNAYRYAIAMVAVTGYKYEWPEDLPPNPRNLTPVLGLDKFLLLPLEDQLKIPSFWPSQQG